VAYITELTGDAGEARLYAPAVVPQRDGRPWLVWATSDDQQVITLRFASVAELTEWLTEALAGVARLNS
jgi:hypothetical protein